MKDSPSQVNFAPVAFILVVVHYLDRIKILAQTNDPRGTVTGFVNSREYRNRFGP